MLFGSGRVGVVGLFRVEGKMTMGLFGMVAVAIFWEIV